MQARSPAVMQATRSTSAREPAQQPCAPASLSPEAALLLHTARNTAFAEAAKGRMVLGMGVLAEALSQEPMAHDLLCDMAALLLASGELEAAASYASQALVIEPMHGASLYTLAFAQRGQGKLRDARDTLRLLMQPKAIDSLVGDGADLLPLVRGELARLDALDLG